MPVRFFLLALTIVFFSGCSAVELSSAKCGNGPGKVFLVRHAEKELTGDNPPLTSAGELRAKLLAKRLASEGITDIFASQTLRTVATAEQVSKDFGVPIQQIPNANPYSLLKSVIGLCEERKVLIVWHMDTLPLIVQQLGGAGRLFLSEEHDRLTILVRSGSSVTELEERY